MPYWKKLMMDLGSISINFSLLSTSNIYNFSMVAEYLGLGLFEPPVEQRKESVARMNADYDYAPPEDRKRYDPGVPTPSEGNMRLQEQRMGRSIPPPKQTGFGGRHDMYSTGLSSHVSPGLLGSPLSRPGTVGLSYNSASPRSTPSIPRKENIKPANPFSENQEKGNPFGSPTSDESLGEDNPFAKGSVPPRASKLLGDGNPFGSRSPSPQPGMSSKAKQTDDYDEDKNPFA